MQLQLSTCIIESYHAFYYIRHAIVVMNMQMFQNQHASAVINMHYWIIIFMLFDAAFNLAC
jgi:hypothetical protein